MRNSDLGKQLGEGPAAPPPPLEEPVPAEERWWDDPEIDADELLRGLAKYALARDSRYDELRKDTTRIAGSLGTAVRELRTFRSEAATRKEVFSRDEVRTLRRRTVYAALFAVIVALALSTLFTLGVVLPKCFFGAIPHPEACHVIPGYSGSEKAQLQRINDLQRGVNAVPENRARIEDLERRVDQLEQGRR